MSGVRPPTWPKRLAAKLLSAGIGARPPIGRAQPGHGQGQTPVMAPEVVLYTARDCHLCETARRVVGDLRSELDFELREVDITGDDGLEARYREWIPVVEIDGERAFTYYVQPDPFRRRIQGVASDADRSRTG